MRTMGGSSAIDEEDPTAEKNQDTNASMRAKTDIDLSSPSFNANHYLAVTHATTSFSSLQNELKELKRTTSDKTEQLKTLVGAHFDQYLSCHEAVRELEEDIRAHQKDTNQLVVEMKNLKQVTDSTLSVMLQRAKEQRRIRNTISVLSRFRQVFEITTKMKESLQNKDYEKLAEDYCRLKHYSTKSNIAALQRVYQSANEIAMAANTELLKHFDDVKLSVQDQKRTIAVLSILGFVEKPALTCLLKQFDYLGRTLEQLAGQKDSSSIVKECASVIYRFRSGLWSFICDIFRTPTGSTAAVNKKSGHGVTSAEAEAIQEKAWTILSTCVRLIEKHSSPPSTTILKQLNESFREIQSLKKCPNAAVLNANIAGLKKSFCDELRAKLVLELLQQECTAHRDQLMQEYFDQVITSIPSLPTESSLDLTLENDNPLSFSILSMGSTPLPEKTSSSKVSQLIGEAREAFEEIRKTSMISSESKIHLHRAAVFASCSKDVRYRWESIWRKVSQVLLETLEIDEPNSGTGSITAGLREALRKAFQTQLQDMISQFLEKLFDSFAEEIAPPTTMASVAGSIHDSDGAGVCILFTIVSNCIELREKCLPMVSKWMSRISESADANEIKGLSAIIHDMEAKCIDMYVSMHSEPLRKILSAGSAEESQHSRASSSATVSSRTASLSSLHTDSRTNSLDSSSIPSPRPSLASTTNPSIPNDCRQYVFNVLLQLITLRSEIETSLGIYPQCLEYVHRVTFQLTAILSQFLEESVQSLASSNPASVEWLRIQLLVEVRFFLFALSELMLEPTKIQLVALEKLLQHTKTSEAAATAQVSLFNQMKHQTKLYLLALRP